MKNNEMKLKFCMGDMAAIALVAALALFVGVWFWANIGTEKGSLAVVYMDGVPVQELSLECDGSYVAEGTYTNTIVVKDGRVSIAESDCPGTDCVHSGWISEAGRSIVCLPNRVEVRIEGASEVDFVVR